MGWRRGGVVSWKQTPLASCTRVGRDVHKHKLNVPMSKLMEGKASVRRLSGVTMYMIFAGVGCSVCWRAGKVSC